MIDFKISVAVALGATHDNVLKKSNYTSQYDPYVSSWVILKKGEVPVLRNDKFTLLITNKPELINHLEVKNENFFSSQLIYIGDPDNLEEKTLSGIDEFWPEGKKQAFYDQLFKKTLRRILSIASSRFYENAFAEVIDLVPDMIWIKDIDGCHVRVNKAFSRMSGLSFDEIYGKKHSEIWRTAPESVGVDPEMKLDCEESDKVVMETKKPHMFDEMLIAPDGLRQFRSYKAPLFDMFHTLCGTMGVARDMADFSNIGPEVTLLLENLPLPLVVLNSNYEVVQMNGSFKTMANITSADLASFQYEEWKGKTLYPGGPKRLDKKFRSTTQEFRMKSERGGGVRYFVLIEQEIRGQLGNMAGYFCLFIDTTAQKRNEKAIEHEANSDSLTGLSNRKHFYEFIKEEWGNPMTLLYMDLDHFKEVNDTYGHARGDHVLRLTADLIVEIFEDGMVARLGGDEFTVTIPGVHTPEELEPRCEQLRDGISKMFRDGEIPVSVSVGIISTDGTADSYESFIQEADRRMYESKSRRKAAEKQA